MSESTAHESKDGRPRRVGRRPGNADTRGAVLAAARSEFAARGYEKASMRGIARAAGVDSALVHHYFGTKDELFLAALDFPLDPRQLAQQVLGGDPDTVGERLVRFALNLWERPDVRERLVAVLRAAATNERFARLVRGFMVGELVARVAAGMRVPQPELRVELAMSQIVGLAMARFVVGLEPLASASDEDLVALVGPTLQRYLTGRWTA